uniref:Uncharacterized protein n=1 Tax=viral metagenome TaxID=1070528 RepID=A0A6C0F0Q1_9ZZZZ
MFIIFFTLAAIIIIYFFDSIIFLFNKYKTGSNSSSIGNIWFVSLLVINILIISFIYGFYNHVSNNTGIQGLPGTAGFPGKEGDGCVITQAQAYC